MTNEEQFRDLLENKPLYYKITTERLRHSDETKVRLKEIEFDCPVCQMVRPYHNRHPQDTLISLSSRYNAEFINASFCCVTCETFIKKFYFYVTKIDENTIGIMKVGEYPQKELPKSKALSKFFAEDKQEYNKAVTCLANGYGVAAFAYMRRIVEKNIDRLLSLIAENIAPDSPLAEKLNELKTTSPMSEKISIANYALPDYLKPDGFNPLGQIYGLLSDGVHSLPDKECLDKAQDLQACLEFMISELADHKKNKENFKSRLNSLRKK